MTTFRSLVLIAASLVSLAVAPAVYAVPFSVTAASFTIGSGYGIDASEVKESATLLDVQFSTATFATQTVALSTVGDTATFEFGTITLQELNAHSGIVSNETDHLEVSVLFTFTDPSGAAEDLVATGVATTTGIATTGSVSDSFVDYTLAWNSLMVNSGTGDIFEISMQTLSFSGTGAQTQTATITLLQQTQTATTTLLQLPNGGPVGVSAVPEPATLALLGLALTALCFVQRNRSA